MQSKLINLSEIINNDVSCENKDYRHVNFLAFTTALLTASTNSHGCTFKEALQKKRVLNILKSVLFTSCFVDVVNSSQEGLSLNREQGVVQKETVC